ncbi:MAG: pentapeptide repeat-containing protein [Coleofasciculaceae cyanobacterium SM2_1_6]|nr:pentapeptide repeat-containing protein [Coleofasciculaceae cyanobacterium SM2_1_6]
MSDGSGGRRKKRLTLIASLEGLEKAKKSLLRLGFESLSNFAEAQLLSRSSVSNFFTRKPIQLDTFKRICEGLTLEWQDIAGMTKENINKESKENKTNLSSSAEVGVEPVKTLVRQITVSDDSSQKVKAEIKLRGDVDSLQNIQLIASILREYGGGTIKIIDIQEGSIKLIIEGSQEDIDRLLLQIESGELTEIDGFPIKSTQVLSEDLEYEGSSKEKWRLVNEIVNNPTTGRNLENVDLSDADLMRANLRGANLSGANLSGANLSGGDLIDAYFKEADFLYVSTGLNQYDLSLANLSGTDLSGADLRHANLSGANLSGANLSGANLMRADLRGANLRGADLRGANLRGAELINTNLRLSNLRGADLSGADLSCTDLTGADLRLTNLRYANLSRTDLTGADLSRAIR